MPKMGAQPAGAQIIRNKKNKGDDMRRGPVGTHQLLKMATSHLGTVQATDGGDDLGVDPEDAHTRDHCALLKENSK